MWRSVPWRSNGFASSSVAGRMASPTTKRNICSLCAGEVRYLWMLSDHPPAWRGSRSRASKNSLRIKLDGVTQKTPLLQAVSRGNLSSRLLALEAQNREAQVREQALRQQLSEEQVRAANLNAQSQKPPVDVQQPSLLALWSSRLVSLW